MPSQIRCTTTTRDIFNNVAYIIKYPSWIFNLSIEITWQNVSECLCLRHESKVGLKTIMSANSSWMKETQ